MTVLMETVAESGEEEWSPVSKHQIDSARVWRMSGLTQDGTAENLTRETNLSGANGDRGNSFSSTPRLQFPSEPWNAPSSHSPTELLSCQAIAYRRRSPPESAGTGPEVLKQAARDGRRRGGGERRRGCQARAAEDGAIAAASEAAKRVAANLGVTIRARPVPVTVCVNDVRRVILRRESSGEWSVIDSAVRAVTLLNEVASVFLVTWVDSDEEEQRVKDAAHASGLTRPSSAGAISTSTAVPEHRLLFCSSHIGQVAVVRQLASSVHIGGPVALLEGVSRFVPSLVRIDPDAVETPPNAGPPPAGSSSSAASCGVRSGTGGREKDVAMERRKKLGGDHLGWREFKSLACATGVASAAAPAVTAEPS